MSTITWRQIHQCTDSLISAKLTRRLCWCSALEMLSGFAPLRCRVSTVKYKLSSLAVGVDDEFARTTFSLAKP